MIRSFTQIALVEALGSARRRPFYLVLIGVVVLAWFSAALGAEDLTMRRAAYTWHLAGIAREQVNPRQRLTGRSVEPVLRVARTPELGSVVARGEDVRLAPYFDFGPSGVVWGRTLASDGAPMQAGALLDLESIVRVVGGLLALLLGIDAVGRSRFRGQLQAWEALGLSPVTGAIGKLAGCCVVLVAAIALLVVVAAVSASLRLPESIWTLTRAFVEASYPFPVYLCGLAATGAAVSLWYRTATSALVAGVAVWVAVAMIGPQLSAVAGRLFLPTMNRSELELARDEEFTADVRAGGEVLGEAVVGLIGQARGEPVDDALKEHQAEMEIISAEQTQAFRQNAQNHEAAWWALRERQARVEQWLKEVIPGASLVQAVDALAGTGTHLAQSWYESAEAHQRQLNVALFDDRPQVTVRLPANDASQTTTFERRSPPHWSTMPAFPANLPSWSRWHEAAGPMVALFTYLMIAVGAVATGARRLTR